MGQRAYASVPELAVSGLGNPFRRTDEELLPSKEVLDAI
jgi:hypothetical protein